MRKIPMLLAALLVVVPAVSAATRDGPVPEIRPFGGIYVPTGSQADVVKRAVVAGGQIGVELVNNLHLLGTVAWTPTRDKLRTNNNRLDLYQYDVGAELFRSTELNSDWLFRPFIGAGVGARTYHLRDVDVNAHTYVTGYGALGAEFQMAQVALRLEGRDYISRFKGVAGNQKASTRNDIGVVAGLSYHLW